MNAMREPVSIKHLVLYALLSCYFVPVASLVVCFFMRLEPTDNVYAHLIAFVLSLGFFGTLIWCILYLPTDQAKARFALIVLLITTALFVLLLLTPTMAG